MAKRVYISPSDQVENKYAWGNTNEHVQCQRIAEAEAAALRRCGVECNLLCVVTKRLAKKAERVYLSLIHISEPTRPY